MTDVTQERVRMLHFVRCVERQGVCLGVSFFFSRTVGLFFFLPEQQLDVKSCEE